MLTLGRSSTLTDKPQASIAFLKVDDIGAFLPRPILVQ